MFKSPKATQGMTPNKQEVKIESDQDGSSEKGREMVCEERARR